MKIAQPFMAGNGNVNDCEVPLGTAEIQSSLRDLIKYWRNFPSDKSLGYCQSLLSELENLHIALLTTGHFFLDKPAGARALSRLATFGRCSSILN
jgi:hypothetical protein